MRNSRLLGGWLASASALAALGLAIAQAQEEAVPATKAQTIERIFNSDAGDSAKEAKGTEDKPRPKLANAAPSRLEVHDWGFWIVDPTLEMGNSKDQFPSALPALAPSPRSRASKPGRPRLPPVSLLTFHGEAAGETDVELRADGAKFLAYWPKPETKSQRIRWLSVTMSPTPKDAGLIAFVGPEEWFDAARALDALYVAHGSRIERFLAYDVEVKLPVPIRLEGGLEDYKVVNASGETLYDVLVIAPNSSGARVGWADELKPDPTKTSKGKGPTKNSALKTAAEPPPSAKAAAVPAQFVLKTTTRPGVAAAPPVEVSKVVAPTLPEGPGGPPVAIHLSAPLPKGGDEFRRRTLTAMATKFVAAGLAQDEANLCVSLSAPAVLNTTDVLVLCRLAPATVDRLLPLEVTPDARKILRTRLLLVRNLDPAAQGEVASLVAKLGDPRYVERESAEERLLELGPIAWPGLKGALNNADLEVVSRAERLLLKQNQTLDPAKPTGGTPPARPAVNVKMIAK